MANSTFQQTNFTAGQISELVYGRTDFSKFYNGVATLQNFIVRKQGPVDRRPGTKYVADAKDTTSIKRLIPFQFSTEQTYMIEAGDLYMRFYRDRDQLMDDGTLKATGGSSTPFEITTLYTTAFSKTITASDHVVLDNIGVGTPVVTWGVSDGLPDGIAKIDMTGATVGLAVGDRCQFEDMVMLTTIGKQLINTTHTVIALEDADTIFVLLDTDPGAMDSVGGSESVLREGMATITVGSSHGFTRGMLVDVSGSGQAEFDGRYRIRRVTSTTITVPLAKSITIAATNTGSWSASVATITIPANHGIQVGDRVTTTGFTPSGYNATTAAVTASTATTIGYTLVADPGGVVSTGGTVKILPSGGTVAAVESNPTKLDYTQSADVLFAGSINEKPQEVQRLEGFTVKAAVFDSFGTGTVTLTIANDSTPHAFVAQDPSVGRFSKIIVSGMVPTGYNGCYNIVAVTPSTVSYDIAASDPGPMTTQGTVDGWQIIPHQFKDGPYLPQNLDPNETVTMALPTNEDKTVTFNGQVRLDQRDIGRWFAHKDGSTDWGNGEIVFHQSAGLLYVHEDMNAVFTGTTVADDWRLGAWSDALGWPWTVSFLDGRLGWGGSNSLNSTFWFSVTNSINNHRPYDKGDETVAADDAIVRAIDDDLVNAIYWMFNTSRGMIIGTDNAEYLIGQTSTAEQLSNNNIQSRPQSFFGSKRFIRPVRVGDTALLFVQKSGRKLVELIYTLDVEGFDARDLSVLSEDITRSGIIDIAYTEDPSPIIWCALGNGKLIGVSYERKQEVVAWHEHTLGGTAASGDDRPKVEAIASIYDDTGAEPISQLWMIVKRQVNSTTVEHVCFLEDGFETGDAIADAFYVDSGVTWTGSGTTVAVGTHLEAETVKVLADGVVVADAVVDGSGNIELAASATKVQAGLGYTSKLETLPIELRQTQPESNRKIKRLERAHVSFLNSQGVQFGVSDATEDLESVEFPDTTTLHSSVVQDMQIQSPYERDQSFWLVNSGLLPTTIRSIAVEVEVQPLQD